MSCEGASLVVLMSLLSQSNFLQARIMYWLMSLCISGFVAGWVDN